MNVLLPAGWRRPGGSQDGARMHANPIWCVFPWRLPCQVPVRRLKETCRLSQQEALRMQFHLRWYPEPMASLGAFGPAASETVRWHPRQQLRILQQPL